MRLVVAELRRHWRLVFGSAVLVALLPAGYIDHTDAGARLLQARALVHGSLTIPLEWVGDEEAQVHLVELSPGRFRSKYGLGMSVIWLPWVATAEAVAAVGGWSFDLVAGALVSTVNSLITVVTAISLHWIAGMLGAPIAGRRLAAGAWLFGTLALPYANSCWSEPAVGLTLLWSFTLPWLGPGTRRFPLAGLLAALMTSIKPEVSVVLPVLLLSSWLARRSGRAESLGPFTFLSLAAMGPLFEFGRNAWDYGSLAGSGYNDLGWENPFSSLVQFLVGADLSMPLFSPGLLLALAAIPWVVRRRALRRMLGLAGGLWLVFLLLYSAWAGSLGGWAFGPRFLVPLLPTTMLFAAWLPIAGKDVGSRLRMALAVLVLLAALPVSWAGTSVRDHQAIRVAKEAGTTQIGTQVRLLRLKLERGPSSPELYRVSEFAPVTTTGDFTIDHRGFRTFRFLNHWWALVWAEGLQRSSAAAPERAGDSV